MKIRSIETFKIRLPFRFAFAHSLASRKESNNLIVRVTLDNGICGYGESVPRDYVTGENISEAENNVLLRYAPLVLALDMDDPARVISGLRSLFNALGLAAKAQGASWCALELAVLDACSRLHLLSVCELLGGRLQERIRYGGVIPFASRVAFPALLGFYKLLNYATVKIKVGGKNLESDLDRVRLARRLLGRDCIIRVDANCAWNLDEALAAAEAFRPYAVSSYEQPMAADDLEGLSRLSRAIEEDVVVDESLCTLDQARLLSREKICDAFNIRISKAGGLLAAQEMIDIALGAGMKIHLGAQVGESGILSAAARHLAFARETMENYEGSANMFLLKKDICCQNLTAGFGGFADLTYAGKICGLGLSIIEPRLYSMTESSAEALPELTAGKGQGSE